ncbi:hypothetical protein [Olleya sp. Bg11-27]|uniref:hypothetical protein n=1 Tax=Olleya sp. Bg11-27 TaxID=2058135 RepID=UPI000C319851|nr:hypothetical protein [Olleya sp. Bg11-27]AUC75389.1 hypothetical protein CW732_06745 [Olleya sp. Bg11-27]
MSDFRNRPKDNFMHEATWEQLYVLTEHWQSDIEFYKQDLNFLHHLIDKYFLYLSKKENIDLVLEIEVNLLDVEKQCNTLLERIHKHLHHLSALVDDPFTYVSDKFRDEHEQLEDDLTQFLKDFRQNRKEVFSITEHMIGGEELIKQLNVLHK